eukprot:40409-Hanusia_phi.AAC.1
MGRHGLVCLPWQHRPCTSAPPPSRSHMNQVTFWSRALKEAEVGQMAGCRVVKGEGNSCPQPRSSLKLLSLQDVVLNLELNETNSVEASDLSSSASNGKYMDSLTPVNRWPSCDLPLLSGKDVFLILPKSSLVSL